MQMRGINTIFAVHEYLILTKPERSCAKAMNPMTHIEGHRGLNDGEFFFSPGKISATSTTEWSALPRSQGEWPKNKSITWADEVPAETGPEIMEDPVPVGLGHAGVNVVARVAELRDLLGQQLDTLGRIAEDDALVNLQLKLVI